MDVRTNIKSRLPSRHVTEGPERAPHRGYLHAMGLATQQIHQPFVGVASCRNEAAPCNISLMRQARAIKKAAAGGSTHAALHLPAIADQCGIKFEVVDIFKKTPCVADLKPAGRYVAKDMFEVGGIPLLMKTLLDNGHFHGDCLTVTGRTIAENLKSVKWNPRPDVVRSADKPNTVTGGVVGLTGNLAPEGAIVKVAGMKVAGMSNLKFSGATRGGCIGQAGPEAAAGGTIALPQDGDLIEIDADVGTLNVKLTDTEQAERKTKWKLRATNHASGALWKYAGQVGSAADGAATHPGGGYEKQCYADI
jgi:dihydroxyacid dehydratase/phosphogluconate dehydratase